MNQTAAYAQIDFTAMIQDKSAIHVKWTHFVIMGFYSTVLRISAQIHTTRPHPLRRQRIASASRACIYLLLQIQIFAQRVVPIPTALDLITRIHHAQFTLFLNLRRKLSRIASATWAIQVQMAVHVRRVSKARTKYWLGILVASSVAKENILMSLASSQMYVTLVKRARPQTQWVPRSVMIARRGSLQLSSDKNPAHSATLVRFQLDLVR